MPELNDEFVQNSSEFDNVEEYKNDIRAKLQAQAQQNAEIEVDNRMLDTIVDNTKISLPDAMVDTETDRMLRGMEAQLSYYGATLETYAAQIGRTVSEIKADQRMMAERQVKGRLVLEKLIRTENIDITEEDIDAKINEIASTQGIKVEEYKKNIGDNGINQIANELLMKKLLDFLRQNNTIK
jgi:trigger factor